LIDHVLLAIILSLLCSLIAAIADRVQLGFSGAAVLSIFGIGIFLFLCAYYIFFETVWNGQTPGKRLIGIRMVRAGGRPIGFLASTIRNFIRLADFLPILYGVGALVMFIDHRSRRLGDLAAGALAVQERKPITLQMLAESESEQAPAVPAVAEITIPNLEALQAEDVRLLEAYLRRRTSLGMEARRRVAGMLLDGFQARLGYPIQGDTEAFLLRVAAEYRLLRSKAEAARG
jgi:uncharacterized RDD family membrane protein YckC